jgi:large repetitive protein
MNKWGFRFFLSFLSLLIFMSGAVPSVSAQSPIADLALTKSADRKHVKLGQNITFTITVTNLGPDTATHVSFGDALPDSLNFVSASCNKGATLGSFCEVASLAVGESAALTLVATPITNPAKSERKFTNTAFIDVSDAFDPNPGNNAVSLHLRIVGKTP